MVINTIIASEYIFLILQMYAKNPIYRSNNGAKVGIFPLLALVLGTFVTHQALIVVLGLASNRFLMKYQKLEV